MSPPTPARIARRVTRFAQKLRYGKLLHSRLFASKEEVAEAESEIRNSKLYSVDWKFHEKMLAADNGKLQQFVQAAWMSVNDRHSTEMQSHFCQTIVKPALRVNVQSIPAQFSDVVTRFATCIATGQASETDLANMKIAAACMDGTLEQHPLLQGLALQCLRMIKKQERGVDTMAGRRSNETSREAELIKDAGMHLSLCSGNKKLAMEFGMSSVSRPVIKICFCLNIIFIFSLVF